MSKPELERLRGEIDRVDDELAALLCERFRLVDEIGALKAACGLPIQDSGREEEILERIKARAGDFGSEAKVIFYLLLLISRSRQEKRRADES